MQTGAGHVGLTGSWTGGKPYPGIVAGALDGPANSGQILFGTNYVNIGAGGTAGGSAPSASANLAAPLTLANTTLYLSFTGNFTQASGLSLFSGTGGSGTSLLTFGSAATGTFGFKSGATAHNSAASSTTTSFLVFEISLGAVGNAHDTVSLFVNPGTSGQAAVPTATWTNLSIATLSTAGSLSLLGPKNVTNKIGNLTFGTTYADVAAVPEPSTVVLAILFGTGMLALFRRHRLC